jgi:hypothetical protein
MDSTAASRQKTVGPTLLVVAKTKADFIIVKVNTESQCYIRVNIEKLTLIIYYKPD